MRFSGFTDEWNEVTLNDVATFSKGKGISKNDISNYGIECVRYGELYTKYNEMIYNIESKTDLDKNELKLSEKNDILIPCSGETAIDLATASCIQKDQVAIGGDITVIKTNQYAPFITYYLNQKKTEIAKYAQGVSIVHLYPKDFKVMNIRIPSINEQKMIIRLLEEITKKEQLLESKYQQYQEFKKYLMQQIFTQKLRFNFNDTWKTVKIKDIFDERSEKGFLDLELLSVTLNDGVIKRSEIESKDNSNENKSNYKHVLPGDIVYNSMRMWQGASGVSPYEGIVSPAYTILIPKNVYSKYFGYYFKTNEMVYQFKKYSQGLTSDTWNLKYPLISEIKIKIPSIEEQKEITNVFEIMDEKIKILQNNIDELTTFKKGLLQQMFVFHSSSNPLNRNLGTNFSSLMQNQSLK